MTPKIFIPRAWQPLMVSHVIDCARGGKFVAMGMGKTTSTLTAVDALQMSGTVRMPLVVGPIRVARSTWPDEVQKWTHLAHMTVAVIVGDVPERERALKQALAGACSFATTNYENLPWLVETLTAWRKPWPFDMLVADELTKLKSFRLRQGGKRAACLRPFAHKDIKRFVGLTGTPSPNGLQDLWGQVWFIDQGQRLGRTYSAFTDRWFQSVPNDGGYSQIRPLPHAQDEIQDAIKDVCLSIDPHDYFDLKKPIQSSVFIDLPYKAKQLYKEMEKQFYIEIEHDLKRYGVEAVNAGAKSQKLRQLASGAIYLDAACDGENHERSRFHKVVHDAKMEALDGIIEEACGAVILVAYQFKSDLARLKKAFPQGRHFDSDPQTLADFKAGKIPLLFIHPKSGGHGVDGMQEACNIIVFFSADWNLEERKQVIERIGPMRQMQAGKDRPVYVYDILARGTIDEIMLSRHESKADVQALLMQALKGAI